MSGAVEPGETQPRALVREVREEVGLVVAPAAKVWECETDDGTFLLHWWTAEVTAGDLVLDPGEVSEARWVTTDEFLRLSPTFDRHREFFTQVVPSLRQAAQRSRDPAGEGEHHLLDG